LVTVALSEQPTSQQTSRALGDPAMHRIGAGHGSTEVMSSPAAT